MNKDLMLYNYRITGVERVIDGDTIVIRGLDLGFGSEVFKLRGIDDDGDPIYYRVRLYGIDTPEKRRGSWCDGLTEEQVDAELARAEQAKQHVESLIKGRKCYFRSRRAGPDNFGRLLGILYVEIDGDLVNVCDDLIERGLAKIYDR